MKSAPSILGFLATMLAASAVVGWVFRVEVLCRVPGAAVVQPATAISLLLLGAALVLRDRDVGPVLGLASLAVGAAASTGLLVVVPWFEVDHPVGVAPGITFDGDTNAGTPSSDHPGTDVVVGVGDSHTFTLTWTPDTDAAWAFTAHFEGDMPGGEWTQDLTGTAGVAVDLEHSIWLVGSTTVFAGDDDSVAPWVDLGDLSTLDLSGPRTYVVWYQETRDDYDELGGGHWPFVIKRTPGDRGWYGRHNLLADSYGFTVDTGTETVNTQDVSPAAKHRFQWSFFALVFDGANTVSWYFNNVLVGTKTLTSGHPPVETSETGKNGVDADFQKFGGIRLFSQAVWPAARTDLLSDLFGTGEPVDFSALDAADRPAHWWYASAGDSTITIVDVLGGADATPHNFVGTEIVADYPSATYTAWRGICAFRPTEVCHSVCSDTAGSVDVGTAWSAGLWFQPVDADDQTLWSTSSTTSTAGIRVYTVSGKVRVTVRADSGNVLTVESANTVTVDAWQHVAVSWSGVYNESPVVYLDGAAESMSTVSATLTGGDVITDSALSLGCLSGVGSGFTSAVGLFRDFVVAPGTEWDATDVGTLLGGDDLTSAATAIGATIYLECGAANDRHVHLDGSSAGILHDLIGGHDFGVTTGGSNQFVTWNGYA